METKGLYFLSKAASTDKRSITGHGMAWHGELVSWSYKPYYLILPSTPLDFPTSTVCYGQITIITFLHNLSQENAMHTLLDSTLLCSASV